MDNSDTYENTGYDFKYCMIIFALISLSLFVSPSICCGHGPIDGTNPE